MKTKGVQRATDKWRDNAGAATTSYQEGVQNPRADWATATKAAEQNYKQAVTKAANEGRFGKGVTKAGTDKQINNSLTKGVQRFGQGVAGATNDYATGVEPFIDVLERTTLPPRGPKGDPGNIKRVEAVTTAMHAAKLAGK